MFARSSPDQHRARRQAEKAANLSALATPSRTLHRATLAVFDGAAKPVEKDKPIQHAGYMAAVRNLGYCQRCGIPCRPQFCHRDETKGMGLKSDCREGWNGCAECHRLVGTVRVYDKQVCRELELTLGSATRAAIRAAGAWPPRLAEWPADQLEGRT